MATAETKLQFEATITGVKPVIAKKDQYGSGTKGELQLTLTLLQPEAPREPQRGWAQPPKGKRPTKEGDPQKRWDQEQTEYERMDQNYQAALAVCKQAAVAHAPRLMQYASMVGIASVFGNTPVQVIITPLNQDLIPGFAAVLLPEPVAVADLDDDAALDGDDSGDDDSDEDGE